MVEVAAERGTGSIIPGIGTQGVNRHAGQGGRGDRGRLGYRQGHGASVVLADREDITPVLSLMGRDRSNLLGCSVDVGDEQSVAALFASVMDRFGRLDVLAHFAGIARRKLIPEMSLEEWDEIMDVNFKGTFLCCRAAIPLMRTSGGGAIVTTGSELAFVGAPNIGAYSASKAGVVHLTRCLARDHAADGIRVNCVCPGPIDTPMLQRSFSLAPDPESARRTAEASTMLGRLGRPEELASMVCYLASDEVSFITGAVMIVDGGVTAKAP